MDNKNGMYWVKPGPYSPGFCVSLLTFYLVTMASNSPKLKRSTQRNSTYGHRRYADTSSEH